MDISVFSQMAKSVQGHLGQQSSFSLFESEKLHANVKFGTAIDYDRSAHLFAATFWERNFWKAAYFFQYEYTKPSLSASRAFQAGSAMDVIVLGAGSAADAAACLAWMDRMFPLQNATLTLIDHSRRQLELAREILEIAMRSLNQANIQIHYRHLNASQWEPKQDSVDLILMSHFLTENPQETDMLIAKSLSALRMRGDVVIIERERDPV